MHFLNILIFCNTCVLFFQTWPYCFLSKSTARHLANTVLQACCTLICSISAIRYCILPQYIKLGGAPHFNIIQVAGCHPNLTCIIIPSAFSYFKIFTNVPTTINPPTEFPCPKPTSKSHTSSTPNSLTPATCFQLQSNYPWLPHKHSQTVGACSDQPQRTSSQPRSCFQRVAAQASASRFPTAARANAPPTSWVCSRHACR